MVLEKKVVGRIIRLYLVLLTCSSQFGCDDGPLDEFAVEYEDFSLLAEDNSTLYGQVCRPLLAEDGEAQTYPAVIVVPGGLGAGYGNVSEGEWPGLAEEGYVVVSFNFRGRGGDNEAPLSGGEEDYNGFGGQDDLRRVILLVAERDDVELNNIGVVGVSYGITAAAGCLGRFPELPVKWLVDVEGPSDSYVSAMEPWELDPDTNGEAVAKALAMFGHYSRERDPSEENNLFWDEREATRFIGRFRGYYLRLQAEWDHAQPPRKDSTPGLFNQPPLWWQNRHAEQMVDAAVTGGVPWVRINRESEGNAVNAVYGYFAPPTWLPGRLSDNSDVPQSSIRELAAMEPLLMR